MLSIVKRLLIVLLILFLGWDVLWGLLGVTPLFPWQLQAQVKKAPAETVLLDVRTSREFQWFHLPGARHVPFGWDASLPGSLPKNAPVVVICFTGHRSPLMAYRLQQAGFTRVSYLIWGMAGWKGWTWLAIILAGKDPEKEMQDETGGIGKGDDFYLPLLSGGPPLS
jgi:rhodanese-related sulfurtransferase